MLIRAEAPLAPGCGSTGVCLDEFSHGRRVGVAALAWGLAVRPVAIIPDVLEVRGQLTQNEVGLRQLIVFASAALVRQRFDPVAHLIGGERVYGLARQQAAEQIDAFGRPGMRGLLRLGPGQLRSQLLDLGIRFCAGLKFTFGCGTAMGFTSTA
jgi:hypothetical protein